MIQTDVKVSSYRDLEVYKLSHSLGVKVHKFSLKLPKYELFETGSQVRRATKSVSANIVEGYGRRRYKAEFIRFLVFAQASCDESCEWVTYLKDCYEEFEVEAESLLKEFEQLGRMLNRFIQAVERSHLT